MCCHCLYRVHFAGSDQIGESNLSFDDLDQILRSFGYVKMQTSELSVGDVMVISGLQSQTALNGQEGVVT